MKSGIKTYSDVCQRFGDGCRVVSKLMYDKDLGTALGWFQSLAALKSLRSDGWGSVGSMEF